MAPAARLAIPRLGVDRIVLDTGSGQAMAFGPTLLPGAARLGEPGTAVIAAHRDTHFAVLKDVRRGDTIALQGIDGTRHRYRVTGAEIVRWDRFALPDDDGGDGGEDAGDDGGASRLALATCYPFDAVEHGPLRYVVHAVEISSQA
jgi:sortase A